MSAPTVIGIDPGKSGGIALLRIDGKPLGVWRMPGTEADVVDLLTRCSTNGTVAALVERVQAFPGTKKSRRCRRCGESYTIVQAQGIASTAKFMQGYGFLRGVLTTLQLRYGFRDVPPKTWQREAGIISPRGATKTEHKNRLKAKAQQMFPGVKVTLYVADALLLAELCRRDVASRLRVLEASR